ncbi:MAG: glycine--tRNA ligase [Candidatus Woesearchaeota archaeon]
MSEEQTQNKPKKEIFGTDDMATFCRSKGFIFTNSEIYGGLKGFFDYGPLGSEMKKNLKDAWWKFHVTDREDVVGIDGSILTHPKVWEASGHAANFADIMVEDSKTGEKHRADVLIEEALNIAADGLNSEQLWKLIEENKILSPAGNPLSMPEQFNLMFTTNVGPKTDKESMAYLRPETAQLMFTNFKQVVETSRLKLPFGIAQMGKAFRNEISPRNFLFRCREFEQMEIEYFIHPKDTNNCPYIDEVLEHELLIYSAEEQEAGNDNQGTVMKMKDALAKNIIKTQWHAYWLATEHKWFTSLGAKSDNFRIRQHVSTEKSHYALDTWDLEYKFPWGWKELQGMANRTDFDLQQHIKHSKKDLSLFDEEAKERIIPHVVAEPSQGVDRAFLVFMFDAYNNDKERGNIVLHFSNKLAPIKVGVFPLVNKNMESAREVFKSLQKEFPCIFDKSGSIGRRYARADEIGIPYCVTVDFDYNEKGTITIRDRDSTNQIIVKKEDIKTTLSKLINNEIDFKNAGELKQ